MKRGGPGKGGSGPPEPPPTGHAYGSNLNTSMKFSKKYPYVTLFQNQS